MKKIVLFICALLIIIEVQVIIVSSKSEPTTWQTGFEDLDEGLAFTRTYWQDEGFDTNNWDNGLKERTAITYDEAASGDSSLELTYAAGEYGSKGTGAQVEIELTPQDEYYASYKIKFSDDFSWGTSNRGGKLPGLTGGDRCGSDFKCDGTDGFGARFMWRYAGYPELYLYSADMENDKYGDSISFMSDGEKMQFETGKWYTITEHVKLNTTAEADDGLVEIWVNGEEVLYKDDITFVTNDQQIDTFYFSSFHGGSNATWAPQVDSYAYFDDLKISTNENNVDFE